MTVPTLRARRVYVVSREADLGRRSGAALSSLRRTRASTVRTTRGPFDRATVRQMQMLLTRVRALDPMRADALIAALLFCAGVVDALVADDAQKPAAVI